ncbi:MAG: peptidoglycan-associated lipoprotein [Candidatus Electrothrix sp. AR3]|nr:peptidoglycan-associated lipoprotein [Candidatus Electrothrix sp. AR3]
MLCLCVFTVFFSPFVLSGCSEKKPDSASEAFQEEVSGDADALGPSESLYTEREQNAASFNDQDISEGRTSGPMLPVYFDFDSAQIQDEQVERMEHNGEFLLENEEMNVQIEGNCDLRGTNEYNLALGERRALAAKRYLQNLGVDQYRLSTISWGEEKPLSFGQDELSLSQNRRDDFILAD